MDIDKCFYPLTLADDSVIPCRYRRDMHDGINQRHSFVDSKAVNSHDALVAALEAVEWRALVSSCPACRKPNSVGHTDDCQLSAALTAAKA